jgi:hypothetical protein
MAGMADSPPITVKRIALAFAVVGVLASPLYLMGRYDSLIPGLGLLEAGPSWCATAVAAYGICRYSVKDYVLAFSICLIGTIFWVWSAYDFNVLQYSQ